MVDAANAPVVAVLTRAPSAGGKTRLFAALGVPPSRELLTALLLDTLDGASVSGVRRLVAVTPAGACAEVRRLVGDLEVVPQPDGDLGARMQGTLAMLFAQGAATAALIGSDLPHITSGAVAEALAVVGRERDVLVLGPAADGGYYLIAARQLPPVFSGIEWGSARVLDQTERAALARGLRVHRLATLDDVDTIDGLRRAALSGRAARTAAWVRAHAPQVVANGLS